MSYLVQQRTESCIEYSNINQNPIYHFQHIFFTNGNGIEFVDGNPVEYVNFNRYVPWAEYYKQETTFTFIKNQYIEYKLSDSVQKTMRLITPDLESFSPESKDKLFQKIYEDHLEQVNNIKNITLEQMVDSTFWLDCLRDEKSYFPYQSLSNGYFKLQEINEKTESVLLNIAVAVTYAHILFYQDIIDNKYKMELYKPILSYEWDDEDIEQCYNQAIHSLKMLKKEYKRLIKL